MKDGLTVGHGTPVAWPFDGAPRPAGNRDEIAELRREISELRWRIAELEGWRRPWLDEPKRCPPWPLPQRPHDYFPTRPPDQYIARAG